jgi:hypothetical protein
LKYEQNFRGKGEGKGGGLRFRKAIFTHTIYPRFLTNEALITIVL